MLKLKSVEGSGVHDKERIVLQLDMKTTDPEESDLGHYAIFACRFSESGSPYAGRIEKAFWFNGKRLKPGDYVILYSKWGVRAEKKLPGGNTSYFYYWGANGPLWDGDVKPVLLETGKWSYLEEQEFTVEPKKAASGSDDDEIPF